MTSGQRTLNSGTVAATASTKKANRPMARPSGGNETQRPNQDSARNNPTAVAIEASAGHNCSQNSASRAAVLTLIYITAVAICFWAAYQVRFDFDVPPTFQSSFLLLALVAISAKLTGLLAFHQFDGLLTYFGKPDLKRLVLAWESRPKAKLMSSGAIWLCIFI